MIVAAAQMWPLKGRAVIYLKWRQARFYLLTGKRKRHRRRVSAWIRRLLSSPGQRRGSSPLTWITLVEARPELRRVHANAHKRLLGLYWLWVTFTGSQEFRPSTVCRLISLESALSPGLLDFLVTADMCFYQNCLCFDVGLCFDSACIYPAASCRG